MTNVLLVTVSALPKILWAIALVLMLASWIAPELALACGTNSGSCGG